MFYKDVFSLFIVVNKKMILGISSILLSVFLCIFALNIGSESVNVTVGDNKTIVIDAGHGGVDGGSVSEDGILEKTINLEIAKKLEKLLSDNGYNVIMTRNEDISLHKNDDASIKNKKTSDLKARAEIGNNSGGGLFISIHTNKYESPEIFGAQVFYSKNDEIGKIYSESIMETLREVNPKNKRLAKPLPNKNLLFQNLKIPAALVECGFISNPDDLKMLQDQEYQDKIAEAIYKGIINSQN